MSRGASPIRMHRAQGGSFRSQSGPEVHRRKLWRLLLCMGFAVAFGYLYVWQHIQTSLIGYRLREVQLANTSLREEITRLRNQRAELVAPARIDTVARDHLGMVRQGTWDLVLLGPPTLPTLAPLPDAASFWEVQQGRWTRLADRLHSTLGPGRALAAPRGTAAETGAHE